MANLAMSVLSWRRRCCWHTPELEGTAAAHFAHCTPTTCLQPSPSAAAQRVRRTPQINARRAHSRLRARAASLRRGRHALDVCYCSTARQRGAAPSTRRRGRSRGDRRRPSRTRAWACYGCCGRRPLVTHKVAGCRPMRVAASVGPLGPTTCRGSCCAGPSEARALALITAGQIGSCAVGIGRSRSARLSCAGEV